MAIASLAKHQWPGNIRKLEHSMEKGVILSDKDMISPEHLSPRNTPMKEKNPSNSLNAGIGKPYQLIFLSSQLKVLGRKLHLVSMRDISREIEQNENN